MNNRHTSTHRIVCWSITSHCNRACPFCLTYSHPLRKHPKYDPIQVVNRLSDLGVEKISYSGGEPFSYPILERTLHHASMKGIQQIITTNGDALFNKIPTWLSLLQYIKISFYGSRSLHDDTMGEGHYNALLLLAKKLFGKGFTVGANYMVTSSSIDYVQEFLLDAAKSNISYVLLITYKRTGKRGLDKKLALTSPSNIALSLAQEFTPIAISLGIKLKAHDFSVGGFYAVLNEKLQMTTPQYEANYPHILGSVFDDMWLLQDGQYLSADRALQNIWQERFTTRAIIAEVEN